MDKLIRTIKAISIKKLEEGEIGFITTDEDKWYNVKGPADGLQILLNTTIQKGNTVEFESEKGVLSNFTLKEKAKPQEQKNWADDMTNFEDLLNAAHDKGLISIHTEMISVDFEKKQAVFKATVTGTMKRETILEKENGEAETIFEERIGTFTGYGDAEAITNEIIKPHFMRMAETRSIVRALRWYTNNAQVAEEETEK